MHWEEAAEEKGSGWLAEGVPAEFDRRRQRLKPLKRSWIEEIGLQIYAVKAVLFSPAKSNLLTQMAADRLVRDWTFYLLHFRCKIWTCAKETKQVFLTFAAHLSQLM